MPPTQLRDISIPVGWNVDWPLALHSQNLGKSYLWLLFFVHRIVSKKSTVFLKIIFGGLTFYVELTWSEVLPWTLWGFSGLLTPWCMRIFSVTLPSKGVYTLRDSIPFTAWMERFRHVCRWLCQSRFTDTTLKIVGSLPLAHRWLHCKDLLPLTRTLPAYFRRCKRSESKVSSISAQ